MKSFLFVLLFSVLVYSGNIHKPKASNLTLSVPGTAQSFSGTELLVKSFHVRAHVDNAGAVFVGGSDVLNTSKNGVLVSPGDMVSFSGLTPNSDSFYNLSDFYFDAANAGDNITVIYLKLE